MTTGDTLPRTSPMVTYDALVLDSIVETKDTRTLVLDVGVPVTYRAGQYVSIAPQQFPGLYSFYTYLEHLKGRAEPPRAYSMCSAPHEPHVAITIKEELYVAGTMEYPPLLSGYLVHQVRPGDRMKTQGFAGAYVLPEDNEARTPHILHLCAGSGSVPNLSMVKDALRRHSRLRHTFVYSNKTWDDVIFRDELARLRQAHPDRLRVVHRLTREKGALPPGEDVALGRVEADLLDFLLKGEPDSLIYACGPAISVWERRFCKARGTTPAPRFLESMVSHLSSLGVPKEKVKMEAFG
jgi:3-ketosteroid 9alpha-monooxygenase subunit B